MAARKLKTDPNARMVRVRLPKGSANEENFVLVSVNGKGYKIKKGEWVEVPDYIADVIERSELMQDLNDALIDSLTDKD